VVLIRTRGCTLACRRRADGWSAGLAAGGVPVGDVVFTVSSLLCASSVDLAELVTMRVLQGVRGAMMVPVGRLAVLGQAAMADIMRLMSYIVWPGLLAPVIAPVVGALINGRADPGPSRRPATGTRRRR
jgi:hypothetical protein